MKIVKKKMNRMQNVRFNNIDEFLEYLPAHELAIVEALRQLVFNCVPHCKEKLSYNVPFYSRYKSICFIWPSSVPWGKVMYNGVRLGFSKGFLLNDELNYLDKGNRKYVYHKDFMSVQDIEKDLDILKYFLFEASMVDEQHAPAKKFKSDPGL